MKPEEQDIARRKEEIVAEVNALFGANMKFTDWDVPEADNEPVSYTHLRAHET